MRLAFADENNTYTNLAKFQDVRYFLLVFAHNSDEYSIQMYFLEFSLGYIVPLAASGAPYCLHRVMIVLGEANSR